MSSGWTSSPLRFRTEKWFWVLATLAVVALYFFDNSLWKQVSILYLALVSNYALVLTLAGAEQSSEAKVLSQ
jgi:cell division protein FtsW (lipid II flippase)